VHQVHPLGDRGDGVRVAGAQPAAHHVEHAAPVRSAFMGSPPEAWVATLPAVIESPDPLGSVGSSSGPRPATMSSSTRASRRARRRAPPARRAS
jgi:hypothetical protein